MVLIDTSAWIGYFNDVPILQIDRDFSLIAENSPLELYLPGD